MILIPLNVKIRYCNYLVALIVVLSCLTSGNKEGAKTSPHYVLPDLSQDDMKSHQDRLKRSIQPQTEGLSSNTNFQYFWALTENATEESNNLDSNPVSTNSESLPSSQNAVSVEAQEGGGYSCRGMTQFMKQQRNTLFSNTIPDLQVNKESIPIVINSRSSCNNVTHVTVTDITGINVSVETCCITNCEHTVEVTLADNRHALLNFTAFNVPGFDLQADDTSEECTELLYVQVDIPDPKNQKSTEVTLGEYCGIKSPSALFVDYDKIKLRLRLRGNKQCVDKMNYVVNIIPCNSMVYGPCNSTDYYSFSEDGGYIISPGKDQGQNYPNNLDCAWNITVPEGKLIQLALNDKQFGEGDFVSVELSDTGGALFPNQLNSSSFSFRWNVTLPSHQCTVRFHSDAFKSGVGFNISYRAVEMTSFVPMFANNSLDCRNRKISQDSKIHCNMHVECAGGEDEESCLYKDSRCWPRGYENKSNCYYPVHNQSQMSWRMAEEYCQQNLSAHLISINTFAEQDFLDKFRAFLGKSFDVTFLGLRRMRMQQVSQLYRRMWQWTDGSTAFYRPKEYRFQGWSRCSLLHSDYFHSTECGKKRHHVSFICEKPLSPVNVPQIHIGTPTMEKRNLSVPVFTCNSRDVIFEEQRCDKVDNCFDHSDEVNCNYEENESTMFSCDTSALLPYSFVCDGINGCPDESDENLCKIPSKSSLGINLSVCNNGMVLERSKICNGIEDCLDGSDEKDCTECTQGSYLCPMIACLPQEWLTDSEIDCPIRDLKGREAGEIFTENVFTSIKPPFGIIWPDGFGKFTIEQTLSLGCPDTHFRCHHGYCIPVYMWCNGVVDCPFGEDEDWSYCKNVCKDMFRCKYSRMCVHGKNLCDNIYQCPHHDDELLCNLNVTCPENCVCKRMEFTCNAAPVFNASDPVPVRYLRLFQAHMPNLLIGGIASYSLIYLNVSNSNVRTIYDENLRFLNLRILDASNNDIDHLGNDTFKHCPVLKTLILTHNKLHNANFGFLQHAKELSKLDLSYNLKTELEDFCFQGASSLQELTLRFMSIEKISKNAFVNLIALKRVDLKGNVLLAVSDPIFHAQKNLKEITTDNYRLCCNTIKPSSVAYSDCKAPYDEISSCADILRTLLLRAALWIMAVLTLLGNFGVIIYRLCIDRGMKQSFRIIITSLSMSDFLMGIYLVIIGSADATYRDNYQLHENVWRNSALCQAAGFLCLLSSETSALFILLVTLDRLLAIAFPMNPRFHFNARSAVIACGIVWVIGLCMASIPLLPPFQHWQLYTQNAVGVPLPITRSVFPGYDYAFAIFIVFNIIVFILVGLGQLMIYLSVRLKHYPKASRVRLRQDTAIAKRLILVVLSDCLCWFPITVMGLAAKAGLPVPGEMNVVATVFLLPANSAFNPFLYTANAIVMARKMRRKKKSIDSDMALRPLSSS